MVSSFISTTLQNTNSIAIFFLNYFRKVFVAIIFTRVLITAMKRFMKLKKSNSNYRPWFPHGKIVRTRGAVNQTALVIFWLSWVLEWEIGDRKSSV